MKYIKEPQGRLYIGDVKRALSRIKNVHLIVTSPPYFDLKQYTPYNEEIGWGQTFEEYASSMQGIINDLYSCLHTGCKCCINIGEYYQRGDGKPYEILPLQSMVITHAQKSGFKYRGSIIWSKVSNTMSTGGETWMGSTYYPRNGVITYEHEYIVVLQKPGKAPETDEEDKYASKLTKEERSEYFRGLWRVPGVKSDHHPAAFPLEIPFRLVKMFSMVGETVLDPFMGSGTTACASVALRREWVGVELSEEFAKQSIRRIRKYARANGAG